MYPGEGVEGLAGGEQLVEEQSRAGEEAHPHHAGSCPPPKHLEEGKRATKPLRPRWRRSSHLGWIVFSLTYQTLFARIAGSRQRESGYVRLDCIWKKGKLLIDE